MPPRRPEGCIRIVVSEEIEAVSMLNACLHVYQAHALDYLSSDRDILQVASSFTSPFEVQVDMRVPKKEIDVEKVRLP